MSDNNNNKAESKNKMTTAQRNKAIELLNGQELNALLDNESYRLVMLKMRFKDEQGLEPLGEYKKVVSEILENYGFKMIKLTKGFQIDFESAEGNFRFKVGVDGVRNFVTGLKA